MARLPRVHYPGAVYHVMLRGNDGQDIFFADCDRSRFFFLCQQAHERYGCRFHAYCLMSNHSHLVVQVLQESLAKIMQNIAFRYAQYVNRCYQRTGHLFQGRYKANLVSKESYLLQVVRYVHLNPVRAGLVDEPGDYRWSSHNDYVTGRCPPWLCRTWTLSLLSEKEPAALKLYRQLINDSHQALDFPLPVDAKNPFLPVDDFGERARHADQRASLNSSVTLDNILDAVCAGFAVSLQDLIRKGKSHPLAQARAAAAYLVLQHEQIPLCDLGRRLQRDPSGLGQSARRFALLAESNDDVGLRMTEIKRKISVSQV